MKKSKVISLVLLPLLICALILPSFVAAQDEYGGKEEVIKKVLNVTMKQLSGYLEPGYQSDGSYFHSGGWCEGGSCHWDVSLSRWKYKAFICRAGMGGGLGEGCESTSFHGYPASINTKWQQSQGLSAFMWHSDSFTFYIDANNKPIKPAAEILYANAVKYGLIAISAQDLDGDGVPDTVDACPGTPAGVAVDDKGCPIGMQLSVSTDKNTYSPGETVIIRGSVCDAKGGLDGATVVVNVDGTKLTATTDSSGKYKCEFPLPPEVTQGTYTVTATASYSGYPDKSESTSFTVGQEALIVEISTNKENYLIGETVYCTITVKDAATGKLVPYVNLKTIATHLKSGKATELSGFTDGLGQNTWSFTWGKKESGEAIIEGKLKIEVTASKEGYADGHKSIILSGCGDLECAEVEDCFDCFEDCKCGANEICDPLSKYTDPKTKCSPKVAYIFISNDPELGAAQRLKMLPRINHIRKYYQSLGYKTSTVYVDDIYDVARYLSRLSTKAIAYFGHATEPSIEHSPPGDIQNIIPQEFRKNYGAKYPDLKEEIKNKAKERAAHPDLDYAYMFTCHSLDDTSLRDYLLHSGGTYWGDKGKLYGLWGLQKSVKP